MKYYYIQSEGNVFLVQDGTKMRLPKPEEVSFETRKVITMKVGEHDVVWCDSGLHSGEGWMVRDDMLTKHDNIDELAKIVAIKSYPRPTAGVFIIRDGKVMLVKPNRGMAKDKWIATGGFIEYGESPEETVHREAEKETGLKVDNLELLSVEKARYSSTNYHFVSVFFTGTAKGDPKKKESEIGEIKWFSSSEISGLSTELANDAALRKLAKRMKT
jgi:ADP-ribose pyrophosphatase YjhB (NUDIX family)